MRYLANFALVAFLFLVVAVLLSTPYMMAGADW